MIRGAADRALPIRDAARPTVGFLSQAKNATTAWHLPIPSTKILG